MSESRKHDQFQLDKISSDESSVEIIDSEHGINSKEDLEALVRENMQLMKVIIMQNSQIIENLQGLNEMLNDNNSDSASIDGKSSNGHLSS